MVPAAPAGEAKPAPAAAPATPAAPGAAVAQVEALKKVPSRYAGSGPELKTYIEAYSARFGVRQRQTDVFGRFQDPSYVPAQPGPIANGNKPKQSYKVPTTPFPDVVAAIEVNTIDLSKRRFFVGSREFRLNSVLNLRLPTGKAVKAQVTQITSKSITFRNPEGGETAVKQVSMMPSGMSRGTSGISAPGMARTGENAPLEVEVSPPSPPISSK
jgi:hypothetical protein